MSKIDKALSDSIIQNEVKELIQEFGEIGLDKILDNEVINQIPIIKTLLSFYRVGVGIRERYTVKKILRFLIQLEEIPSEEKEAFIESLSSDEKYKEEIFEKLLVIIDKLDDLEKSEIIGRLFKATIKNKLDLDSFYKLCAIIERAYINDIKYFCLSNNIELQEVFKEWILPKKSMNRVNQKELTSLGLLEEKIEETYESLYSSHETGKKEYKFSYNKTRLGRLLIEHAY